ncbi:MAG TPA: VOC family protein [Burkholderiaceae bacterium]|nr:VOC family protein [Burkholderiaceae bacterium]
MKTLDTLPETGLDHVGIFGHDLNTLAAVYERLGFQLTPVSQHARPAAPGEPATLRGTGNRCAMLQRGYIELLGVLDPTLDTLGVPEALARHAGMHIVAFDVEEIERTIAGLKSAGIPHTLTYLERDINTLEGTGRAKFTQIKPEAARFPEGRIFMLRHETRSLLWQPRYLSHPNTATRLREVVMAVPDATEAAARYARYLGAQAMTEPGRARFTLAQDTALSLLEPARLAEQFPAVEPTALPMPVAMVVEVQSLASAKTHLEGQGVEAVHHGQRLHVAPEAAAGVALVFEQAPPVRALAP